MSFTMLDVVGQLADLKDTDYKNTLAVAVLTELLIAKGVFTPQEFTAKARELEQASLADVLLSRRAKLRSGK